MNKWFLLLTLSILAFALLRSRGDLSPEEAARLASHGARIIDVRSPAEYVAGNIPDAVNIPLSELSTRIDELGEKSQPLILYCHSGGRSKRATTLLQQAGFSAVHNLGAMSRWPGEITR